MSGRVWFVTGAGSGLGRHIVTQALAAGDRVVATARNPAALGDLVATVPESLLVQPLDVTDAGATAAAVAAALERFGRIDVLCANAGFGMLGTIEEVPDDEVRRVFDTNVFAPLTLLRAALPAMRARRAGHVVLISSISGVAANPGSGIYSASKFALEGIGEALAGELEPFGIRVTLVEPGGLRTGFAGAAIGEAPALDAYRDTAAGQWRYRLRSNDGRQPGDPELAARAIVDLVALEQPPLRLVLGNVALGRARAKLSSMAADIERFAELGASIDRPADKA